MKKYYYDLHMHSCLSPCGDDEMTPNNMAGMGVVAKLDIMALTDHNTCENCASAIKVGESIGITVIPGMELCTSEEVHVVCLFDNIENAMRFSDHVISMMPPVKNRPEIFGEQLIMDEEDNVIGKQEKLLTLASAISISDVCKTVENYGGVCYPAHIDRSSYSVLSNLGMISRFIGMLTDSRSFVSYTRHEYFRRILCNLLGKWVEEGEYPADFEKLEEIAKDICYYNAKNYFNF